jgi:hypothetical protein
MNRLIALNVALMLAAAGWFCLPTPPPAHAAEVVWDVTMKGVSKTMAGDKFKFGGDGTMTWDAVTGDVSFNVMTQAGAWTGTGTMATAQNGKTTYGTVAFDAGGQAAASIFIGKVTKKGKKFAGKFQAASPARLGPSPGGFVLTTGKVSATPRAP